MIIKEPGKYKLLSPLITRTSISGMNLDTGTILNITQVDTIYKKVIGKPLLDWIYWDLDVESII